MNDIEKLTGHIFDFSQKFNSHEYMTLMELLGKINSEFVTNQQELDDLRKCKIMSILSYKTTTIVEQFEQIYKKPCHLCHEIIYTKDQFKTVCDMCEL